MKIFVFLSFPVRHRAKQLLMTCGGPCIVFYILVPRLLATTTMSPAPLRSCNKSLSVCRWSPSSVFRDDGGGDGGIIDRLSCVSL